MQQLEFRQKKRRGTGIFRVPQQFGSSQRIISAAMSAVTRRRRRGARTVTGVMIITGAGLPVGTRRRCTAAAPDPRIVIPVPAVVIDHVGAIVVPVFIRCRSGRHHRRGSRSGRHHLRRGSRSRRHHHRRGSRSRRHHHRRGSRSRRHHHSTGFHHRADQIHDIRRQTHTA